MPSEQRAIPTGESSRSPSPQESLAGTAQALAARGIPVNTYSGCDPFQLSTELAQGHKVMLFIGSAPGAGGETAAQAQAEAALQNLHGPGAGVLVCGIDTQQPGNPRVAISDPASGAMVASYPLSQFVDMVGSTHWPMLATQQPAPPWLPEMAPFDYEAGHVDVMGNLPYATFAQAEERQDGMPQASPALAHAGAASAAPFAVAGGDGMDYLAQIAPETAALIRDANQLEAQIQADAQRPAQEPQGAGKDDGNAGLDYLAQIDPGLAAMLRETNQLVADTYKLIEPYSHGPGTECFDNANLWKRMFMRSQHEFQDYFDRLSRGEVVSEEEQRTYSASMERATLQAQAGAMSQDIRNSVTHSQQKIDADNWALHKSTMATQAEGYARADGAKMDYEGARMWAKAADDAHREVREYDQRTRENQWRDQQFEQDRPQVDPLAPFPGHHAHGQDNPHQHDPGGPADTNDDDPGEG